MKLRQRWNHEEIRTLSPKCAKSGNAGRATFFGHNKYKFDVLDQIAWHLDEKVIYLWICKNSSSLISFTKGSGKRRPVRDRTWDWDRKTPPADKRPFTNSESRDYRRHGRTALYLRACTNADSPFVHHRQVGDTGKLLMSLGLWFGKMLCVLQLLGIHAQ